MKTVSRHSKIAIVVVIASLLFATDAFAASYNVGTHLTIRAPRHVQSGQRFKISGYLRSSKHYCRANSKVQLVSVGQGVVATKHTTARGHYGFRRRIDRTTKFFTRFAGKARGVHPNTRVCRKSTSRKRTVHVG
jgi:hypothetical protein